MRLMARSVLVAWLLPLFFALTASFGTPQAQAQAQGVAQTVVVLDFATGPGLDPLLGRKAADGLAVELQRSGEYQVVPRQQVEAAVAQQAGLQPPFNDTAQIKLAQTVNANSVFSGRVERVELTPGRLARVTLEARQLDVLTGDFVNGTVVTESTEQKLGDVESGILVDEAINKAVFSAVRSMRQTSLPRGNVLNTTVDSVVLNIGAQAGVVPGQRYTVLRDIFDPARNVTERRKIGEVTIQRVNSDQSDARISAGGTVGVRTGDRVRQIFEPSRYPRSTTGSGNSLTPVTAPPPGRQSAGGGLSGLARKSSRGALGLLALGALVALVGFGGGSGNSPPRAVDITEANPTQTFPQPRFTFTAGFNGISIQQTLDRESVVAYVIYRGTAPNFTPDAGSIQAVVDARFDASEKQIVFTDAGIIGTAPRRQVTITSAGAQVDLNISDADLVAGDQIIQTQQQLTIQFTQRPLIIGQTYFYRVGRITGQRSSTVTTTTGGTANTTVMLLPVRSPVSSATGGYTPLFLPRVVPNPDGYDTDNFSLRINTDLSQFTNFILDGQGNVIGFNNFGGIFGYGVPPRANVGSGVTQFRFEVSTTPSFTRSATFVSPDINNPGTIDNTFGGDILLDLGNQSNIRIPSSSQNPYQPGVTPLFVRVLSRNTNDANPTFRISPTFTIQNARGQDRVASNSRFIGNASGGAGSGVSIFRPSGTARTAPGGGRSTRVLPPQ